MARMGKYLCLFLVIILAIPILLIIKPADAQSIPKPSVPEFTLRLVDHSFDVPDREIQTTDPFTGKTFTETLPGYHFENKTVEITIKNPSGATYYNFRWKGHYENEWSYEPFNPANPYILEYSKYVPYNASSSTFTLFTLVFVKVSAITPGGEVDVQVQALYGNFDAVPSQSQPMHGGLIYDFYFKGTTSDWSNTQTLTIPATTISPSPSVPEFPIVALLALVLVPVTLLIVKRKSILMRNVR